MAQFGFSATSANFLRVLRSSSVLIGERKRAFDRRVRREPLAEAAERFKSEPLPGVGLVCRVRIPMLVSVGEPHVPSLSLPCP